MYNETIAKTEGLLLGISSGSVAGSDTNWSGSGLYDKNIVVLLPDGGERYLITSKFLMFNTYYTMALKPYLQS